MQREHFVSVFSNDLILTCKQNKAKLVISYKYVQSDLQIFDRINSFNAEFFIKTLETKGFFQVEIIINILVGFSDSFEYLYDGSMVSRNIFTLTVWGSTLDVRI